jgi:hypothetical protein
MVHFIVNRKSLGYQTGKAWAIPQIDLFYAAVGSRLALLWDNYLSGIA